MHKRSVLAGLVLALLLGISGAARQEPARRDGPGDIKKVQPGTIPATQVRKASVVMGSSVILQGGASYGKIEDLVLSDKGCIDYAVISDGVNYILVPWRVLIVDLQERTVRIDITQEKLKEVTFSKKDWPDLSSPKYADKVRRVFGARTGDPGRGPERTSGERDR